MASVDDRVVAMKFDNAAFEQKIASTIGSLDKLKGSLDFANSKRGIADLSAASKGFHLDGIASAVEGISGKFSAMGAVAFSVINNVVTMAMHAGGQIVKSLALDNVMSGFKEYETNMNSIQTILSNTKSDNTTLTDVNSALDQLNTYSDQTIYNFGQMARNIGTFTAAGVKLDTSVGAIKGIANLAALSGSNADQASTAMYQLSQAMATGTVKLMDWNSVTNAGMGGKVFQQALFESGKALKTIEGIKMDTTFEEWTAGGNSFRSTLEQGWLTGEVLTNTLQGFTGDLTEAQILAMGYTQDQVAGIMEMGKTGKAAATEVKTLTQLMGTVKESIGSGWSASFRIIFGTFDEAKALFTGVNDILGKMIGESADARNKLLQDWKDLGGRTSIIQGLENAFDAVLSILKPIKEAFRDIFPAMTAQRLFELSERFREFTQNLIVGPRVFDQIKRAFTGIFSAVSIGWNIIKGVIDLFRNLFDLFTDGNTAGGILEFAAKIGDGISDLKEKLVDGGGITKFFSNLALDIYWTVQKVIEYFEKFKSTVEAMIKFFKFGFAGITANVSNDFYTFANRVGLAFLFIKEWALKVKDAIVGLFDGFEMPTFDGVGAVVDHVGDRFMWLVTLGHLLVKVWDWVSSKFGAIRDAFGSFSDFIKETFSDLPAKIAAAFSNTDYSTALDTVNVGLFGGFVLLFKKFTGSFSKLGSGLFDGVNKTLGALTGKLEAMQANIKADTLMKIAIAVGILTASMVVLSLIDSGSLTKALTVMAIGFGQLVGVMEALNKLVSGPGAAAKLAILGAGLLLVAGAILILSVALKIMSTMSWEEMAKGLTTVTVLLGVLSGAVKLMSDSSDMIKAGLGIMAIAIALVILGGAMKIFATMSWEEMGKGLAGVAVGLGIITAAMNLLPGNMVSKGLGLLAVAVALNILAAAVKLFSMMSYEDMARGMVGIAGGLLIIAGALQLMPKGGRLVLQGAGLLLISVALNAMAVAVKLMSSMSWSELARGLAALAGVLILLAGAAHVMQSAIGGAIAIGIMSLALGKLADALKEFSGMSWGDLLKGMAGIALILGTIAISALLIQPAIPALLLLGAALLLIGAGMALFGVGANLVATAFAIIATAGTGGVAVLMEALDGLISHLPAIIVALADGLLQLAGKIIEALPELIAGMGEVIGAILQLIIDNVPKFIEAGLTILLSFLKGIRDAIGEIVTVVVEIVTNFLDALALKVDEIIESVYGLIIAIIKGVVNKLVDVASFLLPKGVEFLKGLLDGIEDKVKDVISFFTQLPGKILGWIGNVFNTLKDKGFNLLAGLANGIIEKALDVTDWFTKLPGKILGWLGDLGDTLLGAGKDIMNGLWDGLKSVWESVKNWLGGLTDWIPDWKGPPDKDAVLLFKNGALIMQGLLDGMHTGWDDVTGWLSKLDPADSLATTLSTIPNIIEGLYDFNPTITPVLDLTYVKSEIKNLTKMLDSSQSLSAILSYDQARSISSGVNGHVDELPTTTGGTVLKEIKFEQNIHAPEALSTSDIYRQTRNQIAMAKEELAVL